MHSKKYDLLIKNGIIYPSYQRQDMGIKGGRITSVEDSISPEEAEQVIDAEGCLVSPAFIDGHIHIDKAFLGTGEDLETELSKTSMLQGCYGEDAVTARFKDMDKADAMEDIVTRSSRLLKKCVVNGTTAIKTNVLVNDNWGWASYKATNLLREKFAAYIDIQRVLWYKEKYDAIWRTLAASKGIDVIGGWEYVKPNPTTGRLEYDYNFKPEIDRIFALAKEYSLPIDVHCDENDVPDIQCFRYIVQKTREESMQGRVTCGHVTAMSAHGMQESEIKRALYECKAADVSVSTQTSCNIYLASMDRRGPTRVREMLELGVNVSIGSDNIRDPFRPFGNGDMLEEALLTAQIHKLGTQKELEQVYRMITYNPAKSALLSGYGTTPGCYADLVVLDAPTAAEAILSQVDKKYVIKRGRIVAESGKLLPV